MKSARLGILPSMGWREDPQVFGYSIKDSIGTPDDYITYYENDLTFLEKDSLAGLPGAVLENESIIVPVYDIISEVGKWSGQFKGIRYKMENKIPLNVSAPPTEVSLDTTLWSVHQIVLRWIGNCF